MSTDANDKIPPLAALVQAGEQQTEAAVINDFIFMARDISNAYLVTTGDGDVMINTGFMGSTGRNKTLFAPVRTGPLKTIILTQAHADHYGGVPAFREAGTRIIAGRRFSETCAYFARLDSYLRRRSGKLWSGTIKGRHLEVPKVEPDLLVDDRHAFAQGGRRFEVIATPGGESLDAVVVWLPQQRVVFTGNLFGPVFLAMPNLCTMRGDKPRSAQRYLDSLDIVRQLGAELLITGHGEPIRGADKIRADLDRMHGAVSHVLESTLDGMNAGKDVFTLMREITLPEHLQIGEFHGKVSWAVRTIWEEHSGWFHQDYTTALYAVPRASVDADLVELAGGPGALTARARQKLERGKALEALHLMEIAVGAAPDNADALTVKKTILQHLLQASGGNNLSEVMWLKSEIAAIEAAMGRQ